jgi:OmpA-OmpF porin, OOP family
MTKRRMIACALGLLGMSHGVFAADGTTVGLKPGVYVGADAGWIGYHDNVNGYSFDASGFAYGLTAGYQFNSYVALEGAYLGTGTASSDGADVRTHGWQGTLVGSLPLSPIGGLYARAGVVRWSATASVPSAAIMVGDNGTDGVYGLGGYLTNRQNLTGRLEVTSASIGGTRIYRATLGAVWTF